MAVVVVKVAVVGVVVVGFGVEVDDYAGGGTDSN